MPAPGIGGNPGDPNLPPGFTGNVSGLMGGYSAHPGVAQRFPGRTLAEKVNIFQKKAARESQLQFEAKIRQQAAIEQRLREQRFGTPSPPAAPAAVALEDLAGSEALATSSLDPFFLSPATTLSTDQNVLVPYDAALGTLPVGNQAPTLVPSVLQEPNIFDPQTGFVEPETTLAQGGAVMPGLGFRPLGYLDGGTVLNNPVNEDAPNTLEYQFLREVEKGEDFALAFARTYKNELMRMLQNDAFDRTQTAQIFAQMLGSGRLEGTPIGAGRDMPYPFSKIETIPPEDQDLPPYFNPSNEELRSSQGAFTSPEAGRRSDRDLRNMQNMLPSGVQNMLPSGVTGSLMSPAGLGFGADVTPIEEMVTPEPSLQNLQAGGYVGRGTMAGELGRRGDLSVRQAGETMFERMKRLRGYAHGGYADGYSAPRGTVAGELPRYGDMSVREEGESMGELAKRHQDQDWYNRMGGGLGSLGRRRGIV